MRCVCLISIINDNTAEGRKTHLLLKLRSLMSKLKRTMLKGTAASSELHSLPSLMCQAERFNFAKRTSLKLRMHTYVIMPYDIILHTHIILSPNT